jgi:hypothetical protein
VEHFEGDIALVSEIARQKYSRHAACAERALDQIAIGQSGLKGFQRVIHSDRRGHRG